MNRTRNIIVAVVLFVFLGLIIYSFANPIGNKKKDNTPTEEEKAYTEAETAVKKAETSKEQSDVDTARTLVDKLPAGDKKEDLGKRLDKVQDIIDEDKIGITLSRYPGNLALRVSITANIETTRTDLIDTITYGSGDTCENNVWGSFDVNGSKVFNVTANGTYIVCLKTKGGLTKSATININNIASASDISYTYGLNIGKTTYTYGENFDLSGYSFTATPNLGEKIAIENLSVEGYDNTVLGKQTVTVISKHQDKELKEEVEITVNNKIKDGSSTYTYGNPTKITYVIGDTLDITGSILVVHLATGDEQITVDESMFEGFSTVAPGTYDVTFTYNYNKDGVTFEVSELYVITVNNKIADDALEDYTFTEPTDNQYFLNETMNLTGGSITINLATGPEVINLEESMITGFTTSTLGEKTVTVNYTYNKDGVTVVINETFIIDVVTYKYYAPEKDVYEVGDLLDVTGGYILIPTADEDLRIDLEDSMILGFDSTLPGTFDLDVNYDYVGSEGTIEVRETYSITVNNKIMDGYDAYTFVKPSKTEYFINELQDLTGGTITVNLATGLEVINLEESMVSGFDSSSLGEKTITVTYNYSKDGVEFTVSETYKIKVVTYKFVMPTKEVYVIGDLLDITGGYFTVNTPTGELNVPLTEDMFKDFDATVPGNYAVTIEYDYDNNGETIEVRETYNIIVNNKIADDALEDYTFVAPTKTSYYTNDTIDLEGGSITINLATGPKVIELTPDMITGFMTNNAGTIDIDVSYEYNKDGVSVIVDETYSITVLTDTELTGEANVAITLPTKTSYILGEDLDLTGGLITVKTISGKTNSHDIDTSMISGSFDKDAEGEYTLTITYNGVTKDYIVTYEEAK